jgi:hypothetical protein
MKRSWNFLLTVGLFLLTFVIYASFLTKNYYWDGITFAQTIESADSLNVSLIHPNHLFYEIFSYILYHLTLAIGIPARALTVLQFANCALGAAAVVVIFNILKRALGSSHLAAALSILFAFSSMWWKFTTDADAYIPSILLLLVSFYLIVPSREPRPLPVGFTHALSMCFHQLAVFFFPVAILGIYFQTRNASDKKRLLPILIYAASAFILTFGAYALCFYLQTGRTSQTDLTAWLTSHSPENGFVLNIKESLSYSFDGEFKLFLGGRFGFLKDMPSAMAAILLSLLAASAAVLIWETIQILRHRKQLTISALSEPSKQLVLICILWIGVYLAFLFFWIPKNTFYRMFYLPPLILLIGIALAKIAPQERLTLALYSLVVTIALANFIFYIYPYSKVRSETPLALALNMNAAWTNRTVVYYAEMNTDNQLVRYFNPSTDWQRLDANNLSEVEKEFEDAGRNGEDIWIETTAIKALTQEHHDEWLHKHDCNCGRYSLDNKAYYMLFERLLP